MYKTEWAALHGNISRAPANRSCMAGWRLIALRLTSTVEGWRLAKAVLPRSDDNQDDLFTFGDGNRRQNL